MYQPIFQRNKVFVKINQPLYLYAPKYKIREFEKRLKTLPNLNLILEKSTKSFSIATMPFDRDCFVQIPKCILEFNNGSCNINSIIGDPNSEIYVYDIYDRFLFSFYKRDFHILQRLLDNIVIVPENFRINAIIAGTLKESIIGLTCVVEYNSHLQMQSLKNTNVDGFTDQANNVSETNPHIIHEGKKRKRNEEFDQFLQNPLDLITNEDLLQHDIPNIDH